MKDPNHVDLDYNGESAEEFEKKVQETFYKDNVVPITLYEVYKYNWGTGIWDRNRGAWVKAYISPTGLEIDFEEMGLNVELHLNGIEFIEE